jgi:hypothetical protein
MNSSCKAPESALPGPGPGPGEGAKKDIVITMEWNRSDTLALAVNSCSRCYGVGLVAGKRKTPSPCSCVGRRIFRACYARFMECARNDRSLGLVTRQICSGANRRVIWGMKNEEYMADFCLVSRKHLNAEDYRIFRYHYLLGADWKLCCRRLNMERGNFFHTLYRIEARLGRAFRELEPFPLYPLDDYFNGSRKQPSSKEVTALPVKPAMLRKPVRPPLKRAA